MFTILFLSLAQQSLAQTSTALEGWKLDGNDRSSWDILWTCLTTIFACTWTALHLPVTKYDRLKRIHRNDVKSFALVVAILAPEMLTMKAVQEAWEVKLMLSRCNSAQQGRSTELEKRERRHSSPGPASTTVEVVPGAEKRDPELSVQASVPARTVENVPDGDGRAPRHLHPDPENTATETQCHPSWTFIQISCIRMHGLALQTKDNWVYVVRPANVVPLIEAGIVKPSDLMDSEIKDRAKADSFAKAFTVLQSMWVIFNIIARAAYHLPISPIEISTVAYVVCAVITYAAWWYKPKDMNTPIIIRLPYDRESDEMPLQVRSILDAKRHLWVPAVPPPDDLIVVRIGRITWALLMTAWEKIHRISRIRETSKAPQSSNADEEASRDIHPANSTERFDEVFDGDVYEETKTTSEQCIIDVISFLAGLIFCGIHIAGWNFIFPTRAEQIAWRILSVMAFASCWPLIALTDLPLFKQWHAHGKESPMPDDYMDAGWRYPLMKMFWAMYALARVGNLIVMFTSMRALPSGSFIAISWLATIPHI